jgi:3-phosphoshikimate 1-carboxyvinyltransferase
MPVASAQVKSCLLGAALYAEGRTVVREPVPSRDHTERMLQAMGARIRRDEGIISVEGGGELNPLDVDVPGDISSAAYVVAAGLIVPGPGVRVRGVGLNPTRTGLLSVLRRMGASVRIENEGITSWGEPVGDMVVEYSELSGTEIDGGEIPLLIDELPILAVLAALARGRTVVRGASELRLKESDRIREIVKNLRFMGADAREREDGFQVEGGRGLKGAEIDPSGDHRMAMTFAVAGLAADSPTAIRQSGVASVSFPGFWDLPIFES